LLILANLFAEIAALYARRLLDRDVAAEVLGIYLERTWEGSHGFIRELREEKDSTLFCDWEDMQRDTPRRRLRANRRIARQRKWRILIRGV
jgi:hypothetical protein